MLDLGSYVLRAGGSVEGVCFVPAVIGVMDVVFAEEDEEDGEGKKKDLRNIREKFDRSLLNAVGRLGGGVKKEFKRVIEEEESLEESVDVVECMLDEYG